MPGAMSPLKVTDFDRAIIRDGMTAAAASRRVGVGLSWAYDRVRKLKDQGVLEDKIRIVNSEASGPIPFNALCPSAKRAYQDFDYFRRRYMGHISTPWQIEAAQKAIAAVESDRREYVVINCPPGAGKTQMTIDLAAWFTVRNRRLRGLFGSGTQDKAERMLRSLRIHLERVVPVRSDPDAVRLGMAVDAESTLTADFGLFKPLDKGEPWRADALLVVQPGFELTAEKEHTWMAYGLDTDYLGDRLDVMLWDDAVLPRDYQTVERMDMRHSNFDTITESRLEPTGALFLIGQRIHGTDLYRHCLDKADLPDDDETLDALEEMTDEERAAATLDMTRMYQHVVYRAHYDDRCENQHKRSDPPYPQGCLLSPRRLPWADLRRTRLNDAGHYATWYQQEDGDPSASLVKKCWVDGGTDPDTGVTHWGCWDNTRDIGELPANLTGPLFSYVSVDPSPTKYWGIQWWCVSAGSLITTDRGDVPIEQVETTDRVLTRDGWRPVQHRTYMGRKPVVALELSNGRTLRVTEDHKVLLADGRWVEAGSLEAGTALTVATPSGLPRTLTAGSGSVFAEDRVVAGDLVTSAAVSSSMPNVRRSDHVLPMRDDLQMVRVDARRVAAQMVEFPVDGRTAVAEHPVRETVRQPFSSGRADAPVGQRASVVRVPASDPFPASGGRLAGSGAKPGRVVGDTASLIVGPVPAAHTHPGFGADRRPTLASVHVQSIRRESPIDVYDIGVHGQHEFVAEGVVVHNCYAPNANNGLFLMDIPAQRKFRADDFLEWRHNEGRFTGLAEEWQTRSVALGLPITHWVIEHNGAQRFLLQYEFVRRWTARHGCSIIPHTTTANKNDPKFGVWTIREAWRTGRVNLPKKTDAARLASMKLVDEVVRYPNGAADDQVMSMWMGYTKLPQIAVLPDHPNSRAQRPSWTGSLDMRRQLAAVI